MIAFACPPDKILNIVRNENPFKAQKKGGGAYEIWREGKSQ